LSKRHYFTVLQRPLHYVPLPGSAVRSLWGLNVRAH